MSPLLQMKVYIHIYMEPGSKPQFLNQEDHKGSVNFNDEIIVVFYLGLVECVLVSLGIALILAKFSPILHHQIVSMAARLEYQCLYWGTAVVSNILTYSFHFIALYLLQLYIVQFTDIRSCSTCIYMN